ncbi:histidine kinase [Clostridium estertheticum]|uniref:sensor histidine kinase n=1 Tax=Clostridium estertheticum TaxID=238834 RepID=UPI0013EE96D9|nr:histidine kinase [Clostridium estertheticum]MBZ9607041.1 histidine kinase [Clostridium estertheticum]
MKNKIKDILLIINYILFTGIFLITALYNAENQLLIITLTFLFLTSYTIRVFFIYDSENHKNLSCFSLIIDFIFIFTLNLNDNSHLSLCLYYFMLEDIVLNFKLAFGIIASIFSFVLYCVTLSIMVDFEFASIIVKIFLSLSIFSMIYLMFFLVRYLLKQAEIIEVSLNEITMEKLEKECIYMNLKDAYEKLEMMTIIKERNKIAREIHDTVGHTLTTVLVEIEASKRLMKVNSNLSKEKLCLAQSQVRKGLNDIRTSVRVLEKGDELLEVYPSLEALIKDTQLHSGVVIKTEIDSSLNLNKQAKNVILSSLLEGLTNGIRHGKSNAFLFKLIKKDDKVCFSLEDNGEGAGTLNYGFGLRAMRDRVYDLEGSFDINSDVQEGLELLITLSYSKACLQ